METKKRIWKITISANHYQAIGEGDDAKYFFVGLNNGLQARKKEIYYNQRTKDSESFDVIFYPCPDFISYSFFLGFFKDAIDSLIEKLGNDNDSNIFYKRQIIGLFKAKYVFAFLKNKPESFKKKIDGYLDAAIEERINK